MQLELPASVSEYFFQSYTIVVRTYVWGCELAARCLADMKTMPNRRLWNRAWTPLRSCFGSYVIHTLVEIECLT